jgi:hypothetical protein
MKMHIKPNNLGLFNPTIPAEALVNPNLSAREMILLGCLLSLAPEQYKQYSVNNRYLSRLLNISMRTIRKMISKLEEEHYIFIDTTITDSGNRTRTLRINKEYNKKYATKIRNLYSRLETPPVKNCRGEVKNCRGEVKNCRGVSIHKCMESPSNLKIKKNNHNKKNQLNNKVTKNKKKVKKSRKNSSSHKCMESPDNLKKPLKNNQKKSPVNYRATKISGHIYNNTNTKNIKNKKHCPEKFVNSNLQQKEESVIMRRTTKPGIKPTKPTKKKCAATKTKSTGDKNKPYITLAKTLAEIVESNRNITIQPFQINSWANEIRKLCSSCGIKRSRVRRALKWYSKKIGGKYIPVILSGATLRNKFLNLESAMERDTGSEESIVGLSSKETLEEKYSRNVYKMIDDVLYDPQGNVVE